MNDEPTRLLAQNDEASTHARALLLAGKRDTPKGNLEAGVLATLGIGTVAGLAPSFGAQLLTALKHAVVSKLSVITIATVAAGGGYIAGRMQERSYREPVSAAPMVTAAQTHAVELQVPAPVPVPPPMRTQIVAERPPLPTTPAEPAPRLVRVAPVVSVVEPMAEPEVATSATPVVRPSLAGELDSIKRARTSILARDGKAGLAELDAYEATHPSGTFAEEALALRVRALRLAGDTRGAERALTELRARFPNSVHLAAVTSE